MSHIDKETCLSKLEEPIPPQEGGIPIEFFRKRTSKTARLIDNSNASFSVQGQHKWYNLQLDESIYITKIIFFTNDYTSYDSAEIEWASKSQGSDGKEKTKNKEGAFIFEVNSFVQNISFRPEKKYLAKPEIRRIEVYGLTIKDFSEACQYLSRLDHYKKEIVEDLEAYFIKAEECSGIINEFEDKKKEILTSIDMMEEQRDSLSTEINTLSDSKESLQESINKLKNEESHIISRKQKLDDLIDQKVKDQQGLNTEIADRKIHLRKLKENINLFPSEITGFVDQGAKSITRYTILSSIPILVIILVTASLFLSSADLTVVYKRPEGVDIWTVLLTRIPYVVISATLIHACYRIAKIFISEIIKINRQRLNLSKISIIATDVSNASSEGLDLSSDEHYQLRTKLKMELLREHLKEYIRSDYIYEPTSLSTEEITKKNKSEVDNKVIE